MGLSIRASRAYGCRVCGKYTSTHVFGSVSSFVSLEKENTRASLRLQTERTRVCRLEVIELLRPYSRFVEPGLLKLKHTSRS